MLVLSVLAYGYLIFVLVFAFKSEMRGLSAQHLPKVYMRFAFYILSPILFLFAFFEEFEKKSGGRRWR